MAELGSSDLVEYVKEYGRFSLAERKFTTEDALVLSEFCYLKFDGLVGGLEDNPISLEAIEYHSLKEDLFQDKRYEKDNRALYEAIVESRRFGGLKCAYYINEINLDKGTQFSAVTFMLDGGLTVVTYRGTDETMVGWQEDFAMALKKPIYGQKLSVKYLSEVSKLVEGNLLVAGHSKGGNLATYAPLMSSMKVLKRVEKIYSFDGPGFRPEFLAEHDYGRIADKVVKIIPKSSPVGLFLDTPGEAMIIEAKSVGALQHNPYNWVIKDGKFVESKLTEQHLLMMESTNKWILGLDDEKLPVFVSMLCWMLDATDATTTIEFQDDMAKHAKALFKAGQEVDEEMKEMAQNFLKSYFEFASGRVLEDFREKTDAIFADLRKMYEDIVKGAMTSKESKGGKGSKNALATSKDTGKIDGNASEASLAVGKADGNTSVAKKDAGEAARNATEARRVEREKKAETRRLEKAKLAEIRRLEREKNIEARRVEKEKKLKEKLEKAKDKAESIKYVEK